MKMWARGAFFGEEN